MIPSHVVHAPDQQCTMGQQWDRWVFGWCGSLRAAFSSLVLLAALLPGLRAADNAPIAVPRNPAEASLITQWMLIGPFPSASFCDDAVYGPESKVDLDRGCGGGEPRFRWRGADSTSGQTREGDIQAASAADVRADLLAKGVKADSIERIEGALLQWKPFVPRPEIKDHDVAPIGAVNLVGQFYRDRNASAYAFTRLASDQERDVDFLIGSASGLKVWCNGTLIHDHKVHRIVQMDEDRCHAHLRKGTNDILLKVSSCDGQWGFCFRVADESRAPIPGVTVAPVR